MVVRQVILTMREAQQVVCLVAAVEVQTLQRTMAERMKHGGDGAVRIVYSFTGTTRTFPTTNVGP